MPTPHKHAPVIKAYADGAEVQFYNTVAREWQDVAHPAFYDEYQYRVKPKPHKHQAVIDAKVQCRCPQAGRLDNPWVDLEDEVPDWYEDLEYRIKPEPNPDTHCTVVMRFKEKWNHAEIVAQWQGKQPAGYKHHTYPLVRFTFDGETNELKDVELIK
jgi:hypothetical protein